MNELINIVFLDIDGVLNGLKTKDRCGLFVGIEAAKVLMLKKIVDESNSKIVLVSSWKEGWYKDLDKKQYQDELANYLDYKLSVANLEIYDKTKPDSGRRAKNIKQYIKDLNDKGIFVQKYVILDDEELDYVKENLDEYLVYTDYKIGLQEYDVEKAINILKA